MSRTDLFRVYLMPASAELASDTNIQRQFWTAVEADDVEQVAMIIARTQGEIGKLIDLTSVFQKALEQGKWSVAKFLSLLVSPELAKKVEYVEEKFISAEMLLADSSFANSLQPFEKNVVVLSNMKHFQVKKLVERFVDATGLDLPTQTAKTITVKLHCHDDAKAFVRFARREGYLASFNRADTLSIGDIMWVPSVFVGNIPVDTNPLVLAQFLTTFGTIHSLAILDSNAAMVASDYPTAKQILLLFSQSHWADAGPPRGTSHVVKSESGRGSLFGTDRQRKASNSAHQSSSQSSVGSGRRLHSSNSASSTRDPEAGGERVDGGNRGAEREHGARGVARVGLSQNPLDSDAYALCTQLIVETDPNLWNEYMSGKEDNAFWTAFLMCLRCGYVVAAKWLNEARMKMTVAVSNALTSSEIEADDLKYLGISLHGCHAILDGSNQRIVFRAVRSNALPTSTETLSLHSMSRFEAGDDDEEEDENEEEEENVAKTTAPTTTFNVAAALNGVKPETTEMVRRCEKTFAVNWDKLIVRGPGNRTAIWPQTAHIHGLLTVGFSKPSDNGRIMIVKLNTTFRLLTTDAVKTVKNGLLFRSGIQAAIKTDVSSAAYFNHSPRGNPHMSTCLVANGDSDASSEIKFEDYASPDGASWEWSIPKLTKTEQLLKFAHNTITQEFTADRLLETAANSTCPNTEKTTVQCTQTLRFAKPQGWPRRPWQSESTLKQTAEFSFKLNRSSIEVTFQMLQTLADAEIEELDLGQMYSGLHCQ